MREAKSYRIFGPFDNSRCGGFRLLRMILASGISLAAMGLMIGTAGAYLLTPRMGNLLIGVSPRDPAVFLAIALVLIAATLGASWIPARRATQVDPIEALRCE